MGGWVTRLDFALAGANSGLLTSAATFSWEVTLLTLFPCLNFGVKYFLLNIIADVQKPEQ